ncbi:hypothetical protein PhaeoP23_00759 [Phaeobacter piscinae]|uniref:DUF1203 domain-containing protein n=1 Tax=Phaeobacter piscinae TaxID=1580596 RepID=A0ABM6PBB5_9RHOB|nr:DUF1203 domain-containing protein [Phaeobacter piscinae]ATG34922.1 hypothetical protein PhaeoP36_00759 [Phaeobacter piscinae]AUQ85442.1 hypothetical protein PhaeoP42_00759 [Phaeobacter piscinae]AUR23326.1 hypothetical protein PhaeoP23_00759 [Phaeobacter piscinae]
MKLHFFGLPSAAVEAIHRTGLDSYGDPLERHPSAEEGGMPCRHCLQHVPTGKPFLALAHRPFAGRNPFTETGPIYLCDPLCAPAAPSPEVPAFLTAPQYILRGYDSDERIIYGTGAVTPRTELTAYAEELLSRDDIAFVDLRSASNNCFLCRIHRAD